MIGRLRGTIVAVLFVALTAPAHAADPVLMLLLSIAKELVLAAARRHADAPPEPIAPAFVYPGTAVEPAHVKRMVDEGFGYLSASQREEVFESLHKGLMDPRNAAVRSSMIEYFAERAIAMRMAQERLASLSQREKEALAAQFRKEIQNLSAEEATQLGELLRREVLPLPSDLNEMLLGALAAR